MLQPLFWSNDSALGRLARSLRDAFAREWVRCLIIFLCGFLPHVPALQGELVWDDTFLLRDNPFIRSPIFVFEVFRHHLFLDSFSAHYRPVQNLSMMLDYFFWNNNTFGYHLTNVLLHVGSALVLYALVKRLFLQLLRAGTLAQMTFARGAAFLLALLWVVHPVHSAAVDYLSGRADSLGFLFAASAWWLFLRGGDASRRWARCSLFALAWLAGLLALSSRENACLWIVLFLVYLFAYARPELSRWKWSAAAGCLLLVVAYAGLRHLPAERTISGGSYGWPPSLRAVLMLRALGDYGRLMVYPANLHMERTVFDPRPMIDPAARASQISLEYLSLGGAFLLGAFAFGAFRRGRGQALRVFGALWFIVTYLPISNLFDLNATVAEHWLYLPSVGFVTFVIGCAVELSPGLRRISIGIATLALLALGLRSAVRSNDWVEDLSFYEHTLAAGGSSARVLGNLAQIYSKQGDYAKAEKMFREVLKMSPEYPIARNNLAEALARQGKQKEAEALLASTARQTEETRKDYPRTWIPVINHALYREKEHDNEGALAIAEKARRDYPGVWEIIRFEMNLVHDSKGPAAAIPIVEPFVQGCWWHRDAAIALGRLYAEVGDDQKAEQILRHASWLDLHDADALAVLAGIRMRANRLPEAIAIQEEAVARQPDQPRQYLLLSNIFDKAGRGAEAKAAMAEVTRLRAFANEEKSANEFLN